MTNRQKHNISIVKQAAKELRYAGFSARADLCMVQVVVKNIADFELEALQKKYENVSLICREIA